MYQAPAASQQVSAKPGQDGIARPQAPPAHSRDTGIPSIDWPGRLATLDWEALGEQLTREGCVVIPWLMDADTCAQLGGLFDQEALFGRTVVMDRPEFGRGV